GYRPARETAAPAAPYPCAGSPTARPRAPPNNRLLGRKSRRKMDGEPVTGPLLFWGVADVLRIQRSHGPPRTHPPGIDRGEESTYRLALRPVPAAGASPTATRATRPFARDGRPDPRSLAAATAERRARQGG